MKKLLVALSILLASLPAFAAPINVYQIVGPGGLIDPSLLIQYLAQPITLANPSIQGQILAPDGVAAAPPYSFAAETGTGLFRAAAGSPRFSVLNNPAWRADSAGNFVVGGSVFFSSADPTLQTIDASLIRDAAATIAQRNGVNAQTFRVYNTFTDASNYERGFARWASSVFEVGAEAAGTGSARNMRIRSGAGVLAIQPTGTGANQVAMLQTTVPTCSGSCGTSPSVVGSDTVMIVTMGSSGVPASPFTVTFNGTWAAAPACSVTSALTTMVVGKMAIAVQPSTTTITVTTNGTAPGVSDKYSIICFGVQ